MALVCVVAAGLGSQTVRGRLVETGSAQPIANGVISLLDPLGTARDSTRSDAGGLFVLRSPVPGRYRLSIRRVGFRIAYTPDFTLGRDSTHEAEFAVDARRVILSTVEVRARSEDDLPSLIGLDERTLGGSLITRAMLEPHIATARSLWDLLRWQNIAGLSERDGCITYRAGRCMVMYVNGVRAFDASNVPPDAIKRVIVLRPHEAGTLLGPGSEIRPAAGGAILLYTR